MQNKDNLEEFIRNEVNKVEFDDADSMWQEFQIRLENEASEPKRGWWYWISILSIFLFIALGSFLLGNIYNQRRIADSKRNNEVFTSKEPKPSLHSYHLIQEPPQNDQIEEKDHTRSTVMETGIDHKTGKDEDFDSGNTTKSTKANLTETHSGHLKPGIREKIINLTSNNKSLEYSTANVMDSAQMLIEFEKKKIGQEGFEENTRRENLINPVRLFEPIAKIGFRELLPLQSEESLPPFVNTCEWKASKPKNRFFSIENSFAHNGIRNHALGLGKYYHLSGHSGIKVQAGGSLDIGYSFSQDSVFILNGLSIEEIRKDKDLKHIWNGYIDVGYYRRKNKWQFGLGFRGSYALSNQFYFVKSTQVTHLGTFNNSSGQTIEKTEKGSWLGMNRMSVDAYLHINYQLFPNYSVGFFAGRRLNELIKSDMANQAHSNTPVKLGVVLNKHF